MRVNIFTGAIVWGVLCIATSLEAAIYLDGQLYSEDVLNIVDLSFNDVYILATETSVVNVYGDQTNSDCVSAAISLTGNAVANVHYADMITNYGYGDIYQPAIRFDIGAHNTSTINVIIPENDSFSFVLWDTADYLSENFTDVYMGLCLNSSNYSPIDYTELWREYGGGVGQILAPFVGVIQLDDDAELKFVPEPISLMLLAGGACLVIHKNVVSKHKSLK